MNGIKVADLHANSAVYAGFFVNDVRLSPLAADGMYRAISGANCAACTGFCLYFKTNEGAADFCGASFFVNVRFVFVAEMFKGADDGVGRSLTQPAQAVA
jgi:GT2 family glycosyltransferase